jgi:hypothetical protein
LQLDVPVIPLLENASSEGVAEPWIAKKSQTIQERVGYSTQRSWYIPHVSAGIRPHVIEIISCSVLH